MPKTKPIGKLVDDCAVLTQKLVRLKAADKHGMCRCVTCGKRQHWKEADGGHFISRTYSRWKLAEENIHVQCKGCNRFGHKVADNYAIYMIDMYGADHVRHMVETKREVIKWNRVELEELKADLRKRVKELEAITP